MSTNLPVVAHAELGASSASRWMACPGSVRLSRGLPNVGSAYSREGTTAHELAKMCLEKHADPRMFIGASIAGIEVSEEMAEYVDIYVQHARARNELADEFWIEHQFNLHALNPPAPMFGTSDDTAYFADDELLEVIDLKFGAGVVVEVEQNKQLMYYGLGAALSLGVGRKIRRVRLTIVQPRVAHRDGVVRSWEIDYLELVAYAGELLEAARGTLAPDAPLIAGAHCRFCLAAGRCPELHKQAQSVAQIEFADVPEDRPPAPGILPLPLFAELLGKLSILEDWIKAMRAHAQERLERGEEVPGFKLVPRRANRKWVEESQVITWLRERGYAPEEYLDQSLRSPVQIEKVMGKQKKILPPDFIEKKSSGYTLVPDSDPREAVQITPGEEFAAIPAEIE